MKKLTALLLGLAMCFSHQVQAHKIKTAFSIILFNDRTRHIEVVHRYYLHDSEEAVWALFDKNADIIGSEETQATFAEYAVGQFAMKDQNGRDLPIATLGYQIEGGYFWVYQETPYQTGLTELYIKQSALKDVWSEQFNMVNIEGLDKVYSLNFSDRDEWLGIEIKSKQTQ